MGAQKAFEFLMNHKFDQNFAERVAHCILCHRYRNDNTPQSMEAKILFDADKPDAAGTTGIARTLLYKGQRSVPLYTLDEKGMVFNGEDDSLQ